MALRIWVRCALIAATVVLGNTVEAQNAPGEDPVIMVRKVTVQMQPLAGSRASTPLQSQAGIPAYLQAKVARFEAQANSARLDGLQTDADVVRTATSDGFKKTCIQEVGSTSTAGTAAGGTKPGTGNNQQIVVLRGDLINICK